MKSRRCSLRIKDLDLERRELRVRRAKGRKDRITMIPASLVAPLRSQIELIRPQFASDLQRDVEVPLPDALSAKYPNAGKEWPWRWLFPGARVHVDEVRGLQLRGHIHPSNVQHVKTTQRYTHVLNSGALGLRSPLDDFPYP
ncbi:MAG: hypothetical protein OXT09_25115 [Myxococcales bacterium]|nr:hypothetical protein [Myxococcales bacterium]